MIERRATRATLLFATLLCLAIPAARAADDVSAIVADRVYVSPEREPLAHATVVVTNGKISAVGPSAEVAIPPGARVVRGNGMTLTAGFWNSHVHFIEPRFQDAAKRPAAELEAALRDMLTSRGFVHAFEIANFQIENTLAMRERIERGEVKGPSILTVGVPFVPPNGGPGYLPEHSFPEIADPATARAFVAKQIAAGADGIKFWSESPTRHGVVPMPIDVAKAAVEAAHAAGKPVFAHPTNNRGVRIAAESGVDVLAHTSPEGFEPWSDEFVAMLKSRGMAITPTLKLFRWDPERQEVPAPIVQRLMKTTEEQLRKYSDAGGTILFGTDVGYITDYDTAEEFAAMGRAGMNAAKILASLTTAPARKFGAASRTGTIAPGMDADLVLLGDDPRTDVKAFTDVRLAMRRGVVLFEK